MGIDVGPDRTGYLAVGALADLALFDVPAGPDAVAELVEAGAGRAAATIVSGEVRYTATGVELDAGSAAHRAGRSQEGHLA
jgi:imidazolonepropionase-like amidohydrolase